MNKAYCFKIGPLNFILNVQQNGIGYTYPRLFVNFPDNSHLNFDLTLGVAFSMTEKEWMSWLDGTENRLDDIDEVHKVLEECGLDIEQFNKFVDRLFEYCKDIS